MEKEKEDKVSMKAKEDDSEEKEPRGQRRAMMRVNRARGRFRTRRNTSELSTSVERHSYTGTCDNWWRRGEFQGEKHR